MMKRLESVETQRFPRRLTYLPVRPPVVPSEVFGVGARRVQIPSEKIYLEDLGGVGLVNSDSLFDAMESWGHCLCWMLGRAVHFHLCESQVISVLQLIKRTPTPKKKTHTYTNMKHGHPSPTNCSRVVPSWLLTMLVRNPDEDHTVDRVEPETTGLPHGPCHKIHPVRENQAHLKLAKPGYSAPSVHKTCWPVKKTRTSPDQGPPFRGN